MSKPKNESIGLPTPADECDEKLLADVKKHGWHVLGVGVTEDEGGPGFAYSIGLYYTFKHPEVIVFGLDIQKAHPMINGIGEEIRSGKRFEHLDEAGDILKGYNVQFRKVDGKHYRDHLGYARWFYQGDDFPVLQCVWPDNLHRYPWHPEFNTNLVQRQPVLSQDKTWPFHEGKNLASFTTKPVIEDKHPILRVSHDINRSAACPGHYLASIRGDVQDRPRRSRLPSPLLERLAWITTSFLFLLPQLDELALFPSPPGFCRPLAHHVFVLARLDHLTGDLGAENHVVAHAACRAVVVSEIVASGHALQKVLVTNASLPGQNFRKFQGVLSRLHVVFGGSLLMRFSFLGHLVTSSIAFRHC